MVSEMSMDYCYGFSDEYGLLTLFQRRVWSDVLVSVMIKRSCIGFSDEYKVLYLFQ